MDLKDYVIEATKDTTKFGVDLKEVAKRVATLMEDEIKLILKNKNLFEENPGRSIYKSTFRQRPFERRI